MSFLVLIAALLCAEDLSRGGCAENSVPRLPRWSGSYAKFNFSCLLCSVTAGGWYLVWGLSHWLWEQAYKCHFLRGHLAHGGAQRGHHMGLYGMLPKWLWESSWLYEYQLCKSSSEFLQVFKTSPTANATVTHICLPQFSSDDQGKFFQRRVTQ